MQDYFEQLIECRRMSGDIQDMSTKIRLEALLRQLLLMSRTTKGDSPEAGRPHTVVKVLAYLNENITAPVVLDELASRFFISKHHLNKIFRKATGTTVGNYVIRKRVALARQLMMRGQSAISASANAGFQDTLLSSGLTRMCSDMLPPGRRARCCFNKKEELAGSSFTANFVGMTWFLSVCSQR